MAQSLQPISPTDLDAFLQKLEDWVSTEVASTDSKAQDSRAPQSYCNDMKGFARGKSMMGHQLINKIRKQFLSDD